MLVVVIFLSGRTTRGELATFAVNPRGVLGEERQISYLDVLLADQSRRGKVFDRSVDGLKDPVNVLTLSESNVLSGDTTLEESGRTSSLNYIFVAQFMSNQVLKISPSGVSTLFAKGVYCADSSKPCSILDGPWGLEYFDRRLFVSSFSSDQILVFNITNGEYISAFGNSIELNCPEGIAMGGDGYLYVVSYLNNEIVRYNPMTYEYVDVIVKPGTISGPEDVLYMNSVLVISSHWSNSILCYNATPASALAAEKNHTGFDLLFEYGQNEIGSVMQAPVGLLQYSDEEVIVSLQGEVNKLIKINIFTGESSIFAQYKRMKAPSGMAWLAKTWHDPPKTLVVAAYVSNTLYVFNRTKTKFELVARLT